MKKFVLSSLLAMGLAASAQAVIVGASAGYLVDSEEAYLTVRVGTEFNVSEKFAHAAELEIGYTEASDAGISVDLLPVMLNYRATPVMTGNWGPTFGFGAGMARTKVNTWFADADDWSFAVQAFAGINYKATETVSLNVGARYIWIDAVTLFGSSIDVGDDLAVEVGLSLKF